MANTTITNKPSVNDTVINYNLKVGTVKAQPKPLQRGEHVSHLSVADQVWQGTKSGLKMSAWTGISNFAGVFTTESYNSKTNALGPNILIGASPILVGAVSGTVTGIANNVFGANMDDKVGKTMNELAGGKLTAANVGFKTGVVANGLLLPRIANEAAMNSRAGAFVPTFILGSMAVATSAGAAHVGAKFAKGSASTGGTVFAGAAGGALTGAGGGAVIEFTRHAFAGTLKTARYGGATANIKSALVVGALYGAAIGITGALVQKATRKAG